MLFDEYKLKNLTLRNRVLMAPMTRNQSPGGIPTEKVVSYYSRRAKAEVGMIITEGIEVSHKASSAYPDVPRLDSADAREGWKKVVAGIKDNNGAVIAQLGIVVDLESLACSQIQKFLVIQHPDL